MSILAGDLNAKHPVWSSKVSNTSGLKLLQLFVSSNSEISAPQCSTHATPDGRGDVIDIVAHQKVQLSEIVVTDNLGSDHLPVNFSILDPVRTREALDPVEKLTLETLSKPRL
jgi:endonuclease/exonuclease/phosphatase (EEP) superfamily protein YafD